VGGGEGKSSMVYRKDLGGLEGKRWGNGFQRDRKEQHYMNNHQGKKTKGQPVQQGSYLRGGKRGLSAFLRDKRTIGKRRKKKKGGVRRQLKWGSSIGRRGSKSLLRTLMKRKKERIGGEGSSKGKKKDYEKRAWFRGEIYQNEGREKGFPM